MKMNQKGIAPLIIVAIVAVVAVAAGVGIYAATRGGGGGGGGGEGISGAQSLQFDVNATVGGVSTTYTLMAKNIGTSNLMMKIDGTFAGQAIIYIVNGAQQKVWMYAAGQWTDLSEGFSTYWSQWSQTFQGYKTGLSGWTGGTWTSSDGTVTISNIQVNPSLSDSLFEHS